MVLSAQQTKLLLALFCLCFGYYLSAQTILQPGDLAVVAVNANNAACSGNTGEDLISFVCFKDILPDTEIDLTDNGWERENANTFGNSEGIVRMRRTGGLIPAGTVITLQAQGIGGDLKIVGPDTLWSVTALNDTANNVNLNNGGDQIIFMQGGTWFNGTTSGFAGFSHDARYDGGRFLFAFNTRTNWNSFAGDTQNSGLPVELMTCFNMAPAAAASDFLAYAGSLDETTQSDWIQRIANPANWQIFTSCVSFPVPPGRLDLAASEISLACEIGSFCEPFLETFYFNLPTTSGPYTVDYTINGDTFSRAGLSNRDTIQVQIDTAATIRLLVVNDANSCPTFSDLGGAVRSSVEPISVQYNLNGSTCDTTCRTLDITFTGNGPFLLRYYLSFEGPDQLDTLISLTNNRSISICPADYPDTLDQVFVVLQDVIDLNCQMDLNQSVEVYSGGPKVFDLTQTLCSGDTLRVNNTVYSEQNPTGTEVFIGGAAGGCDSIVNVNLNFESSITGGLSGDATICLGDTTAITFDLPATGSYTVEVSDDQAGSLFLGNIQNGDRFPVSPGTTTTYTLRSVASNNSSCRAEPDQSITVAISDFDLSIAPSIDYGGFGVSCSDASDGALLGTVTGDSGPYLFNWSTGENGQMIESLTAGVYELEVSDLGGCLKTASYELRAPAPLSVRLGRDSSGCGGSSSALIIENIQGGLGPYEYSADGQFFNGVNNFPITDASLTPGNYALTIQDANDCLINSNFTIGGSGELDLDLGPDFAIKAGDSTIIKAAVSFDPSTINWTNAEAATFLSPLEIRVKPAQTTTYALRLESIDGCFLEDFITVFVERSQGYFAPTGFSPNNDGINDRFTLFGDSQVVQFTYFRVFSRWGQLLYQAEGLPPNDEINGWNGEYQNEPAPGGPYLYTAEIEYADGRKEIISGDFLLIR